MAAQGNYVSGLSNDVNWAKGLTDTLNELSKQYMEQAAKKKELAAKQAERELVQARFDQERQDVLARQKVVDARHEKERAEDLALKEQARQDILDEKAAKEAEEGAILQAIKDVSMKQGQYAPHKQLLKQLPEVQQSIDENFKNIKAEIGRSLIREGMRNGTDAEMLAKQGQGIEDDNWGIAENTIPRDVLGAIEAGRKQAKAEGRNDPFFTEFDKRVAQARELYEKAAYGVVTPTKENVFNSVFNELIDRKVPVATATAVAKAKANYLPSAEKVNSARASLQEQANARAEKEADIQFKVWKEQFNSNTKSRITPGRMSELEVAEKLDAIDPGWYDKPRMLSYWREITDPKNPDAINPKIAYEFLVDDITVGAFNTKNLETTSLADFKAKAKAFEAANAGKTSIPDYRDFLPKYRQIPSLDSPEAIQANLKAILGDTNSRINSLYGSRPFGNVPYSPASATNVEEPLKQAVIDEEALPKQVVADVTTGTPIEIPSRDILQADKNTATRVEEFRQQISSDVVSDENLIHLDNFYQTAPDAKQIVTMGGALNLTPEQSLRQYEKYNDVIESRGATSPRMKVGAAEYQERKNFVKHINDVLGKGFIDTDTLFIMDIDSNGKQRAPLEIARDINSRLSGFNKLTTADMLRMRDDPAFVAQKIKEANNLIAIDFREDVIRNRLSDRAGDWFTDTVGETVGDKWDQLFSDKDPTSPEYQKEMQARADKFGIRVDRLNALNDLEKYIHMHMGTEASNDGDFSKYLGVMGDSISNDTNTQAALEFGVFVASLLPPVRGARLLYQAGKGAFKAGQRLFGSTAKNAARSKAAAQAAGKDVRAAKEAFEKATKEFAENPSRANKKLVEKTKKEFEKQKEIFSKANQKAKVDREVLNSKKPTTPKPSRDELTPPRRPPREREGLKEHVPFKDRINNTGQRKVFRTP